MFPQPLLAPGRGLREGRFLSHNITLFISSTAQPSAKVGRAETSLESDPRGDPGSRRRGGFQEAARRLPRRRMKGSLESGSDICHVMVLIVIKASQMSACLAQQPHKVGVFIPILRIKTWQAAERRPLTLSHHRPKTEAGARACRPFTQTCLHFRRPQDRI